MDKLKSITSKLTTSTPGEKLSKAFRLDKDHTVMGRSTGDPFHDGPILEEPSLPRSHLWLHCASMFLTFLAICTMGGVAGFQAKWVGVSGGTGFTIFVLIVAFLLTVFLLLTPLIYDRWDRLKRPAQFLQIPRSTLILHAFGTGLMFLASMIVTISAWTAPGCKNPDNDPNASLGDEFKNGLSQWCTTKRASAIFDWMSFGLSFHRERKESRRREPAFIPPTDPYAYGSGVGGLGASSLGVGVNHDAYTTVNTTAFDDEDQERYTTEPKPDYTTYESNPQAYSSSAGGYDRPSAITRLSGYGDDEPSRTMQLAYNASDPFRSSLMSGQANSYDQQTHIPAPATYAQAQQLPHPPHYGGYR